MSHYLLAEGVAGYTVVITIKSMDVCSTGVESGFGLAASRKIGAPGMGSTVVALLSRDKHYEIAWVGDSRAYLWIPGESGGTLTQLTTDHSYVQMLVASGAIKEEEAQHHSDKNIITQCLGSQNVRLLKVDSVKGEWKDNQWIMLCSDGLTEEVDNELLAKILYDARDPEQAANLLLQKALENGGSDNVTVQVIAAPDLDITTPFETHEPKNHRLNYFILGTLAVLAILALVYFYLDGG